MAPGEWYGMLGEGGGRASMGFLGRPQFCCQSQAGASEADRLRSGHYFHHMHF